MCSSDLDKATDKTVFASIEGKGGKLTIEDGKIRSLKEGESYTYTIQPEEGYRIFSVKLNGVEVKDRVQNGQLTLTYEELQSNNELVIQYISDAAAQRYEEKGLEIVEPVKVYVPATGFDPIEAPANNNTLVIVCSVVAAVALAGAAAVITVFVVRNKKKTSKN